MKQFSRSAPIAACAILAIGCVQPLGGTLVKQDYRPQVLIAYRAEGDVSPSVRYYLVREKGNLAVFEQDEDGAGILMERHWVDAHGDHFAVWGPPGAASEVLVPADHSRPAYRFVYAAGRYAIRNRDGVEHPVPILLTEASTQLLPAGSQLRVPVPRAPAASGSSNGPDHLFH